MIYTNEGLTDLLNEQYAKVKKLESLLSEAIDIVSFYADGTTWQSYNMGDEVPIRSDREDHYSVPGRRARIFIAELNELNKELK